MPYQWRAAQSKGVLQDTVNLSKSEDLINVTFTRNPDDVIAELPPSGSEEEVEEDAKQIKEIQNETVKGNQTPESTDLKSDDENIETDDSVDTDVNVNIEINREKSEEETKDVESEKEVALNNENIEEPINKPDVPTFEKINLRQVDKSDDAKYIINSKPANKDFDYIKATPMTVKSKLPVIDPIEELRNISRKSSNAGDDDPPFNFQGMLRKTNFRRDSLKHSVEVVRKESLKKIIDTARRDSLKNAVEALRRFSLGKDQENNVDIATNGSDAEEPVLYKPVELELLPGLILNGFEVEL